MMSYSLLGRKTEANFPQIPSTRLGLKSVKREFGFLKDAVKILDPDWEKKPTLTDEEIEALGKATY